METAEKPNKVLEHIKELISTPKQYADRQFSEPERPAFLDDFMTSEEEEEIVDEIHEETSEEEIGTEAYEIESEQDLSFYAGGFLAVLTFGIEKILALMNNSEPEEYELDKHEEKHLRQQAAMLMKSKKIKAKPATWFYLSLAVIYGQSFITGCISTGQRLFGWFRNRSAKKEEAAKLAAAEAQKKSALQQAQTLAHEQELVDRLQVLEAKLRQALEQKPAEQPKTSSPDPKPKKGKLDIPDQSQTKAPTLEQVRQKHKQGFCILPGCTNALGTNKHFCGNAHRIAYTGATQRKTDPYPKTTDL